MKLVKSILGKQVRVRWRDQRQLHVKSLYADRHDVPRGRKTLAYYEEWGVVDSIEDGVLHLLQSVGSEPPSEEGRMDELSISVVPEEAIELLVILEDKPEPPQAVPAREA